MDVKAYIESGILEDYVLGHVSEQELKEVRCLSSVYPQIEAEIVAIENRLMKLSESNADDMPQMDMQSFMKRVETTEQISEESDLKPDGVSTKKTSRRPMFGTWQVAAAILFIISASAVWMVMNLNSNNSDLAENNQNLRLEMDRVNEELIEKELLAAIVSDKDVRKISLESTDTSINQYASIYWNVREKEVYLDASNLPDPPKGKQYQLWTLKDGQPYDQGMVPLESHGVHIMKSAEAADAFAITLEDEGGVESPTLTELKVLGKA